MRAWITPLRFIYLNIIIFSKISLTKHGLVFNGENWWRIFQILYLFITYVFFYFYAHYKKIFFIKFSNFRSTTFVLRIARKAFFVVQEQILTKGSWLVISGTILTAKMLLTSTQSMLI